MNRHLTVILVAELLMLPVAASCNSLLDDCDNCAYVDLEDAIFSTAIIDQSFDGGIIEGNVANIQQSGRDHFAMIKQNGFKNTADIDQSGANNIAIIKQFGSNKSASITQDGVDNVAFTKQLGADKSEIDVTQNGNENFAVVVSKYGNNSPISYTQEGKQG